MNKKEAIQYLGNLSIPPMTSNLPEAVIEHQKYIDALRIAQQSLQNEINLIIELEKLKEEIRERANECQDYQTHINSLMYTQTYINGLMYTYTIIEKYISELKGESNE